MGNLLASIARRFLLAISKILFVVLLDVKISGEENIPQSDEPLILVANHFSWFDVPLLTALLPLKPVFMVATESRRMLSVRIFMRLFNGIPIWRGQVDRNAFVEAKHVLQHGGVLGVFPEGGIDPEKSSQASRGTVILDSRYTWVSRVSGQLTRPRPGTAFLAVDTDARLLPVGLLGTEKIADEVFNWRRLLMRRSRIAVEIKIGPAFGPLTIDPALRGQERRNHINHLADTIMRKIAELFPPEKRGPYRV
ncbi:MAG: lysophospholipid acyltransferase family protein [Chloroflexota bacterium]